MSILDLLTGVGVPGLHVGVNLLQSTYQNLENVKLYRQQCEDISNRCVVLLLALRDSSVGLEGQRPLELVDEVSAIVQRVHRKVNDWARLNQLRSFVQQGEIKQGIDSLHRDIDMAMQNINIQLGLHLARGQLETRAIQERDRAEIRELLERIVNSIEDMRALTEAHPSEIEGVMVSLQNELRDSELEPNQQRDFRYGLWQIHERTAKLPPMEDLTGQVTITSRRIAARGTYNDIYKGEWLDKESRFEREVTIWRGLTHKNVVPLYGFLRIDDDLYSVSPWMDNGTVNDFIKKNPEVDRLRILSEIAEGMEYLHQEKVIHGDLHGANVLISRDGMPRLSDFGMSKFLEDCGKGMTSSPTINPRWGACELLRAGGTISTFSDVWSFAMVALEILSGDLPFSHIQGDAVVQHEVYLGRSPQRPGRDVTARGLNDDLWALMKRCWNGTPQARPSMTEIREKLLSIRGLTPAAGKVAASPERFPIRSIFRRQSTANSGTKNRALPVSTGPSPPEIQEKSEISSRKHTPSSSSSSSFPPGTIASPIPRSARPSSTTTYPPRSGRTKPRLDIPTGPAYLPEIGDIIYCSPSSEQASSSAVSQSSGDSSLRSLEQTTLLPQGEAIYHLNSSMSVSSGTLEGLVERLIDTNNLQKDLEYRDVLLATLVDFTLAENFFAMLARRFYNAELDQQLHPRNRVDIQYNVYALTLYWVSNSNFYVDAPLLSRMKEFCISALSVKRSSTMNDKAKEVLHAIDARSASATISESPVCDIPRSSDMQPKHLAIALTLMEGDKYRAILPADYIIYLTRETENRVEAAKKVNKEIQFWVQYTIIRSDRLAERTRSLVFFVNTGQECLKMRNFASVAAIATALQSETIQNHLKTTLEQLTSRQRQSMDGLINIINPAYKYQAYHKSLGQPAQLFERERCVPWIDVHIQDLGSVLQSNRLTIEREGRTLINFERHIRFIDKVKEVLYYKSPDLEGYRSLGYLRYLEHRLRNIRLDDPKFEQKLLKEAKDRELEEGSMRRHRTPELGRLGFRTTY
ncbi:kinase-like domain-containing protein [Armillaria novae-zelandiae]|uniref:Kinase-like domain-containing protein n=1 Tax=Armillaria novae-zelandiae TaxID=153914 RepID=A0AA39PFN6_9AGAR|nr:kinase-like domain-containing protein [Armillaria novae-zelandiae]